MTELLERSLPATTPTRIRRRQLSSLPRSFRQLRPAARSITDPSLTTQQYNEMLARVVRTVEPVGI